MKEERSKRRYREEKTLRFLISPAGIRGAGNKKIPENIPAAQIGPASLKRWMADWMKNPSAKLEIK